MAHKTHTLTTELHGRMMSETGVEPATMGCLCKLTFSSLLEKPIVLIFIVKFTQTST